MSYFMQQSQLIQPTDVESSRHVFRLCRGCKFRDVRQSVSRDFRDRSIDRSKDWIGGSIDRSINKE